MNIDGSTMERLVFIKSLHQEANEQAQSPQPVASQSILTYHDSVELFLYLSAEHIDINPPHAIMQYWNEIKQHSDIELTQKAGIDRLNQARKSLKHYGNRPTKADIESFKDTVADFFKENTPIVFGIEYGDVSLTEIIEDDDVREKVGRVEKFQESGDFGKALENLALAFSDLINNFEKSIEDEYDRSAFRFGRRMRSESSYTRDLDYREHRGLSRFVDDAVRSIDELKNAMRMLAIGVDFNKYIRFSSVTPNVVYGTDHKQVLPSPEEIDVNDVSEQEIQFCIDFIIETAIHLQERK
jgi:hypothetical protein